MSDRRYSQEELATLRFVSLEWGGKPAMVFADAEGRPVRISITRAAVTEIVRSAVPMLLPIDSDGSDTAATLIRTSRPDGSGVGKSA